MESLIKPLVFVSIALVSYGAEASLIKNTEAQQQNKQLVIAQLDKLTNVKTSIRCIGKNCQLNAVTTLSYNPESKRYTTYIAANNDHLAGKTQTSLTALKDGLVVTTKLVSDWGFNALRREANNYQQKLSQGTEKMLFMISSNIPLSTAIWVFLGGLFGLLATQRRKELE
ncbi:MAG: hypothetical protein Q8N35_16825 [Methylococcaceae bacterium]|jgi:hypothetical protein|nr:hypothetical protein [Methylococcaceae bacterium]MDZ4157848.1 hypothetical protein [Methylococcales bacterium]MDP2392353.1 hypothetical protein [Methylococcaceae bacterium]MDP3021247.1 hypothetical protein [Methylococcaceae bacterium]MDP3389797.1 hypothetical protein [Methylococcaceae bacterium]